MINLVRMTTYVDNTAFFSVQLYRHRQDSNL